MPTLDLDRSDRVIVEAEQRMTRHALRIAAMEAKGKSTTAATLMLEVCEDTLAKLNAVRKNIART